MHKQRRNPAAVLNVLRALPERIAHARSRLVGQPMPRQGRRDLTQCPRRFTGKHRKLHWHIDRAHAWNHYSVSHTRVLFMFGGQVDFAYFFARTHVHFWHSKMDIARSQSKQKQHAHETHTREEAVMHLLTYTHTHTLQMLAGPPCHPIINPRIGTHLAAFGRRRVLQDVVDHMRQTGGAQQRETVREVLALAQHDLHFLGHYGRDASQQRSTAQHTTQEHTQKTHAHANGARRC